MVRKSTVFLSCCIMASFVYVFVLDPFLGSDVTGNSHFDLIKKKIINSVRNLPGLNKEMKSRLTLLSLQQDVRVDKNTSDLIRSSSLRFNLSAKTMGIVKEKTTIRLTEKKVIARVDQPNILNLARSLQNVQDNKATYSNGHSKKNRGRYKYISASKPEIFSDVDGGRKTKATEDRKWSNQNREINVAKNIEENGRLDARQINDIHRYSSTFAPQGPAQEFKPTQNPNKVGIKDSKLQPGVPVPHTDIKGTQSWVPNPQIDRKGIQSGVPAPHTDVKGIQSGVPVPHTDLKGIKSGEPTPHKDLKGVQSGVQAPHTDQKPNLIDAKGNTADSASKEIHKKVPKGMPAQGEHPVDKAKHLTKSAAQKLEIKSGPPQNSRAQQEFRVTTTKRIPLPLSPASGLTAKPRVTLPVIATTTTAPAFYSYHINAKKKAALAELFKNFHENDANYEKYELNASLSHTISLDRPLEDTRPIKCKKTKYPDMQNKLSVSVIVPFFEEEYSVLLRCIHSILNRTPREFLTEIILIDDCSTLESLKKPLKQYLDALKKVRFFHMPKREGLIRARMMGARAARGNVLVFLDAHVECNEGWIQPLLYEIYKDRTSIVLPSIDYIKPTTFSYNSPTRLEHGTFTWKLDFIWKDIKGRVLDLSNAKPFPSATMVGCSFAVERNYFFEMGAYDEGMYIWGGENLEMSFRTWMCGGSMKIVPCSRVGHVFRTFLPYDIISKNIVHKNLQRVADVWMDDYKRYFYATTAKHLPMTHAEKQSLQNRVNLRSKLHCRSFKWYMDNIVPGLITPPVDAVVHGQLKNVGSEQCAIFNVTANQIQFVHCGRQTDEQVFYYNNKNQIVHNGKCVRYQQNDIMLAVLAKCDSRDRQQLWTFYSHMEEDIKESLKGFDYYKPGGSFRLKYGKKKISLYQIIDHNDVSTTGLLANNVRNRYQYWLFTDQFLYRNNLTGRY